MKRTTLTFILVLFWGVYSIGQDDGGETEDARYLQKGQVSVGMRTTTSLFGHDNIPGLGVGGQTRWQIFDFMNTEWFADWITLDLKGAGTRNNAHIGWSVMFYPKQFGRITPYVVAGHCFDYAKVIPLSTPYEDRSDEIVTRWSSAIQMGLGSHFFLNDRFDISLQAQYMLHLGKHLDYELNETPSGYYLTTGTEASGVGMEGHVLITASMNIRLADLW
ncbi:MAG: hypothetical protein HUJ25_17980 [Crocinitomicaceae bacterium]|nr:hypothetical protein [Crocinitomicaceae bacterium]